MSQDECSTEARMYTRRKPKEGTTRSGATAPTERNCADKAPVRQQSATHKRSKTKSRFCVVLKTYHLDTWILHKTCLKHSNFLNRKILCTIVSTWNIMVTAMGQGTEEKHNKLRQGSKHGNYNTNTPRSPRASIGSLMTSNCRPVCRRQPVMIER